MITSYSALDRTMVCTTTDLRCAIRIILQEAFESRDFIRILSRPVKITWIADTSNPTTRWDNFRLLW
eukprot:g21275.t1